jgi:2-isopropylmalate synthase
VQAGASIINCPDTIGGASRFQGSDFFVNQMQKHAAIIKQEFPTIDVIWSTHCHNDLGLAVDNSLTAVFSGPARQIEGCINGVGERAGNASLEQCILLIDLFGQQVSAEFNYFTEIKLERLTAISNFVAERMLVRQPHWPITGENAARHSSGGHTNAILKNPMAYQPFEPSKVGNKISFVFGPLSGSNHAKNILEQNGFICPPETKTAIAEAIKNRYQDRRKGITDEELVEGYKEYFAPIKMTHINYSKDHQDKARLEIEGEFFSEQNIVVDCDGGNSALAALDKAVKQFVPGIEIIDYRSNACGNTVNAKCSATVIVSIEAGEHYMGKAVDADITIAAMKAYVNAVNLAYVHCYYRIKEEVYV